MATLLRTRTVAPEATPVKNRHSPSTNGLLATAPNGMSACRSSFSDFPGLRDFRPQLIACEADTGNTELGLLEERRDLAFNEA
jgi:hypothetical protein